MAGDLGPGRWSAADTSPAEIEAALRELLKERFAEHETFAPARVLNLVVVADHDWKGEIQNRLDQVGRHHASRTILCAVQPGRTTLDAHAEITVEDEAPSGEMVAGTEQVTITCGERHLPGLDTIVDPLVVTDLATLVWAPHRHREGLDALMSLAQIVLVDSVNEPDPAEAVSRALALSERAYVVDLAWLRSTPWRERVAASFDPPLWREELRRISSVTARHRPDSGSAAVLFFGWLAARLGWQVESLVGRDGSRYGTARGMRQEVTLKMTPDPQMRAPGLAGVTVETASGMSLALDRGPGGLAAKRRLADGRESAFTVMGASRGEAGILGEGIRQALLRDHTYGPSLEAAASMLT
ncbi:MAG: glucose-6-phosphate dehydrogenase assembly protein OpcA [Actinomycetota bacterium]|nr:glucose-6-phosphate dehydrogenase assembly protein OpcA [Actinomycetota bacterium]